jgi:hypothetical protein
MNILKRIIWILLLPVRLPVLVFVVCGDVLSFPFQWLLTGKINPYLNNFIEKNEKILVNWPLKKI